MAILEFRIRKKGFFAFAIRASNDLVIAVTRSWEVWRIF